MVSDLRFEVVLPPNFGHCAYKLKTDSLGPGKGVSRVKVFIIAAKITKTNYEAHGVGKRIKSLLLGDSTREVVVFH